ncbi:MAG: hypothetical protein ACLPX9_21450, partial [Rhodomicrobium sp.]
MTLAFSFCRHAALLAKASDRRLDVRRDSLAGRDAHGVLDRQGGQKAGSRIQVNGRFLNQAMQIIGVPSGDFSSEFQAFLIGSGTQEI